MTLLSGRPESQLEIPDPSPCQLLQLVDESISPNVSRALRLVGYHTAHVVDVGLRTADDPELFDWIERHDAKVWIHQDNKALKRFKRQIREIGFSTLCLRPPRTGLNSQQELRAISYVMDRFLKMVQEGRGPAHCDIKVSPQPKMRIELSSRSFRSR